MEIIHVVLGKANPARMNGVNKVVHELASQQAMAGEDVAVWGITDSLVHDYPERNFTTHLFQAQKNLFTLDEKLKSAALAKKDKAVFHLHGGFIPTFYSFSRFLHREDIAFVFTPHGSYNVIALEKSKWRKKIYINLYEKKLLRYAQSVHCLGKSELDGLNRLYPTQKGVLIPYGFSLDRPKSQEPEMNGPFIIGFCGRIDIYTKGLDLLLEAFARFQQRVPNSELWIIGDSAERTDLEDMAKELNISRSITFWGSQYGEDKFNLLEKIHLFAHPSRNEGLPTSVLEVSAMGIPCVVTEATNVGDAIREYNAGAVITEPDAKALQLAIEDVYTTIKTNGLCGYQQNAKRMIREKYNWSVLISQFKKLYQRA